MFVRYTFPSTRADVFHLVNGADGVDTAALLLGDRVQDFDALLVEALCDADCVGEQHRLHAVRLLVEDLLQARSLQGTGHRAQGGTSITPRVDDVHALGSGPAPAEEQETGAKQPSAVATGGVDGADGVDTTALLLGDRVQDFDGSATLLLLTAPQLLLLTARL
ncbi:hypothetical protein B484DRAFT_390037 [Ochromonadaceae sp. CCMP2298]|nr:hypothetical protein B484DRAFT_390037 [Ochromonadaceae sp. CCMP2298]